MEVKMNSFLKEAKKWIKLKESFAFVIGNESSDLDSVVCAVSLAYFYTKSAKIPEYLLINGDNRFLPVMNITRENLPLKTEVTYFMKEHSIDTADLVCRDEVPAELLSQSRFILVDNHVTNLPIQNENIIEIIDHRPIDKMNANFSNKCRTKIVEVGSCATLIAERILALDDTKLEFNDLLGFLHGPIVMDTINFSESAGKAKPLDVEVNGKIEKLLHLTADDRTRLYHNLLTAIADVSSLSAYQLLSKDLKVISNRDKSIYVAIPGYPLLVEEYLTKNDVWSQLRRFAKEKSSDIVVLMGVKKSPSGDIRRDLALVRFNEAPHCKRIIDAITLEHSEFLQLKKKSVITPDSIECHLFEQENVKASRKQVLPIVQKILDN